MIRKPKNDTGLDAVTTSLSGRSRRKEAIERNLLRRNVTPIPTPLSVFSCLLKRYFYLADPEGGQGGDLEAGELWSFAAAVLPRIHECDANVAATIRANTDIVSAAAPMSDGYLFLKEEVESVYSCLGISCSQVNERQQLSCTVFTGT